MDLEIEKGELCVLLGPSGSGKSTLDYLPAYENKAINFAGEDMGGDGASMEIFLYIVVAVLAFIVAVTTINTLSKEESCVSLLGKHNSHRLHVCGHIPV